MIRAAPPSTFSAVSDRMRLIVERDVVPRVCWVIAVPERDERGTAWQHAITGMWLAATCRCPTRMRVQFSELGVMPEGRVLVLIGVRRA